ncbi:hypothetical protein [Streptomyces lateritius]|uniref:hypothetical protein n=1 Tax=Streptomyces lateritius TaxID=67313 RepID=UPI0016767984|nr:hypothetical protein [Streptomyces lateritius]GGU12954.1 hypothetical protein GCM10010272_67750 [Streptomyces lateritius]
MSEPLIEDPTTGMDAFLKEGEVAAWSQAAQILGLGLQLNGHRVVLQEEEDAYHLNIPEVPELTPDFIAPWAELFVQDHFDERLPFRWLNYPGWSQPIQSESTNQITPAPDRWWESELGGRAFEMMPRLYDAVRTSDDPAAAAATLLHVGQLSHHQVVRVVSAALLAQRKTTLWWPTIEALADGCTSDSETIQQIAIEALLRVAPGHPILKTLPQDNEPNDGDELAWTSIIVPGTWTRFRRPSWWRPGETLFRYLQNEPGVDDPNDGTLIAVGEDLYDRDDHYRWTGGYTVEDRIAAARDLAQWAAKHSAPRFKKVIAHSHGGNVALNAAAFNGLSIDMLVMLHTPPHQRSQAEWSLIGERIKRIIAMRPKFDFVVMLDRCWTGFHRTPVTGNFPSERVRTLKVPLWFDHSALTDPQAWRKHRLASEVAAEFNHVD